MKRVYRSIIRSYMDTCPSEDKINLENKSCKSSYKVNSKTIDALLTGENDFNFKWFGWNHFEINIIFALLECI